jgi:hypothetical protein
MLASTLFTLILLPSLLRSREKDYPGNQTTPVTQAIQT